MRSGRLEAFSDGVLAIIITIMVLELRAPEGASLDALRPLLPKGLAYLLSFVLIGIYWNNHHHLLQLVERIDSRVLWANMHLLFWLSLIPFTTAWMGEHARASTPVGAYGVTLLGAAFAYFLLTRALLAIHGPPSRLRAAIGNDLKGRISAVAYAVAIPVAAVLPEVSLAIYVAVALVWFIPDRRISRIVDAETQPGGGGGSMGTGGIGGSAIGPNPGA